MCSPVNTHVCNQKQSTLLPHHRLHHAATWPPGVGFNWGYNYVVSSVTLTDPPWRKQRNTNQYHRILFPVLQQSCSTLATKMFSEQPNSRCFSLSLFLQRQNLWWASVWFNDVFLMTAGVICIRANRALLQCSGWFNDVGCRNKFIFGNCQEGVLTELTMACCLFSSTHTPTESALSFYWNAPEAYTVTPCIFFYDAINSFFVSFYILLLYSVNITACAHVFRI